MPQFHRIFFALRHTWSVSGAYMRERRILFGPTISVLPSMILGTPVISACAVTLPNINAASVPPRNFIVWPPTNWGDATLIHLAIKYRQRDSVGICCRVAATL